MNQEKEDEAMTKPNEKQVEIANKCTYDMVNDEADHYIVDGVILKKYAYHIAKAIADAVAEERESITQEVKKATELLVEALKDMLFAHQNCDPEFPHEYEIKAREKAEALLKAHKEKYGELS